MILRDELSHGFLTDQEYNDYLNLFRHAANRIFKKHADFQKEVDLMTKPLIELPSVVQKWLQAENDALAANPHHLLKKDIIASIQPRLPLHFSMKRHARLN